MIVAFGRILGVDTLEPLAMAEVAGDVLMADAKNIKLLLA